MKEKVGVVLDRNTQPLPNASKKPLALFLMFRSILYMMHKLIKDLPECKAQQ